MPAQYYSAPLNNESEYRNLQLYVYEVELWGQWQDADNVYTSVLTPLEALYY